VAGAVTGSPVGAALAKLDGWWFRPMPRGRIAALRVIIYLFVWYDVFSYSPDVGERAGVPGLYQPLAVERLLHLPTPTHTLATIVQIALPCVATAAATGRAPRLLGAITFVLYLDWIAMGDSFGYVAHDRFAFVVALAVLPTVGSARRGDRTASTRAGWALRCIQVAVVATYFLSACAKFRFGGLHWAEGSVLTWAVLRRGTPLARHLLDAPWLLHVSQWGILCAELASPFVLFLRGRVLYAAVAAMLSFHLVSFVSIGISFLPHVLCLAAFLPLERLGGWAATRRLRDRQPAVPLRLDETPEVASR
jgi:hypothetical protein